MLYADYEVDVEIIRETVDAARDNDYINRTLFLFLLFKNCSLLSFIIAHGIYDAMISVWASLLIT